MRIQNLFACKLRRCICVTVPLFVYKMFLLVIIRRQKTPNGSSRSRHKRYSMWYHQWFLIPRKIKVKERQRPPHELPDFAAEAWSFSRLIHLLQWTYIYKRTDSGHSVSFQSPCDVTQIGRGDLGKSLGTSSVDILETVLVTAYFWRKALYWGRLIFICITKFRLFRGDKMGHL